MNAPIEVHVDIGGVTRQAGTLYAHTGRSNAATFLYDDRYLAAPDAYALDPGMPLTSGQFQTRAGQALFGIFADSAPDRWGRTLIQRVAKHQASVARTPARGLAEVDYLLGVRDDLRQGALRFRTENAGPFLADDELGVPPLVQLPQLLALAAKAQAHTANLDDLRRLVHVGSSLGGARPKAHVTSAAGRIAIAKFPSSSTDTWNVMAWEKVAHDLAHQAGIHVPQSLLLEIEGRSVHVVDRFDRVDGQRVGYASAMTMLEAADGDRRSYLDIAAVIEERSPRATEELHQLWRRMAFSVLISNTDDHLRNHAFLHVGGDKWQLSPAFDINPNPEPGPKELTCAIDEYDSAATVANLYKVSEHFRLDAASARAMLTEVVTSTQRWRKVARHLGLSGAEIEHMAPAFEHPEATVAAQ